MAKKCGFDLAKHETMHLLQWMQKHSKQHHGMQSSPNHFLDLLKFESKTVEG
jgi:predicted small metal-binding protein